MGWCHEFGPDINADCGHPMVADAKSCKCATCGVVCTGRFSGCAAVWAAGPRKVNAVRGALTQRRLTPPPAPVDAASASDADPVPADDGQLDALRADLASVMRRLDDVQVEAVRADLAAVAQRLETLTSAVAAQRQELQRLAERPAPAPPRPAEQSTARPPQADRGPQPPPRPRGPEPTRPNGGSAGPARTTPTAVPAAAAVTPAPGEPEQVDLAVPLDQALLRPAGTDPGSR